MKILYILFFGFALMLPAAAQKKPLFYEVDRKVKQMPQQPDITLEKLSGFIDQEFKTPQEKVRAVYVWLSENIAYDVKGLVLTPPIGAGKGLVDHTLKSRKAVCQGYAEVFQELCTKVGIKASLVSGYTRQQGVTRFVGHAWCAAQIDGKWYLFDPTWGAGYVEGNMFVKHFNEQYFMVAPAAMIQTHYPFDPLWQFSSSPVKAQEFQNGISSLKLAPASLQLTDTLTHYLAAEEPARLKGTVRRMEAHGIDNAFQLEYLQLFKQGMDYYTLQIISASYNKGIDLLNQSILHRNNRQFTKKREDEMKQLISTSITYLQEAKGQMEKSTWEIQNPQVALLESNLKEALTQAMEQESYISRFYNPFGLSKKR